MSKTLSPAEALRALADGKTLKWKSLTISLELNGELVVRDKGGWADNLDVSDWTLAEAKNPHQVGTWHWAGFESDRGKIVCRRSRHLSPREPGSLWSDRSFSGHEVNATDWQVVE